VDELRRVDREPVLVHMLHLETLEVAVEQVHGQRGDSGLDIELAMTGHSNLPLPGSAQTDGETRVCGP